MSDFEKYLEEEAIPFPDALITSSRAIGYNLKTAISDIIDNSISASAKAIDLQWGWNNRDSWIAVVDDGSGMNLEELVAAMRLGSVDPAEERNLSDLGRFGLGMKTASFSQCKSLTVLSKKEGYHSVTRTWDLDLVRELKEWRLTSMVPEMDEFPKWKSLLDKRGSGTVVLWTKLDRIIGEPDGFSEQDRIEFVSCLKDVVDHVGVTFHRFLDLKGISKVAITINGTAIDSFDPGIASAGSKRRLLEKRERNDGAVEIQGMTIPYFASLSPEEHREWRSNQWYDMQGFYVYRGKRLLVAGDWLGMFRKSEASKHARVFINLRNSEDHSWRIDVKKSMAIPPTDLNKVLRQAAQEARMASEMMFGKRQSARRVSEANEVADIPVWHLKKTRESALVPEVNTKHPLIAQTLENLTSSRLQYLLKVIAREIPIHQIIAANEKDPDQLLKSTPTNLTHEDIDAASFMVSQFVAAGKPRAWAIAQVVALGFFEGKRTQLQAELEALNL